MSAILFALLHLLLSANIFLKGCFALVVIVLPRIAATKLRVARRLPQFNRDPEPPVVRSWIPWVGNGIKYFTMPATFFINCSRRYGSVFKILVFGQPMVVISSPVAVHNFLRDRTGFFDVVDFQEMHLLSGISGPKEHLQRIYAVIEQNAGVATRSLSPRNLQKTTTPLVSKLLEHLDGSSSSSPISLHDFVHRTLYYSVSAALLGPHFPLQTYEDFMTFDEDVPLVVRRLGSFARKGTAARERLVKAYTEYFSSNWNDEGDGYLEGASNVMSDIFRSLKMTELTDEEKVRIMGSILWAFHTNVMRVTMWVMCHILTDRETADRINKEVRAVVDERYSDVTSMTSMDPKELDGDKFRFLTSLTREVLRTKSLSISVRQAIQDTVILDENDKEILIRKGELVVADMPSMHFSSSLQDNPTLFKADRYFDKPSYKSVVFGTGKHMCAGRHYALYLVRMFVVLTVSLYDIKVENATPGYPTSLPKIDQGVFSYLTFVRPENDLYISLHQREL